MSTLVSNTLLAKHLLFLVKTFVFSMFFKIHTRGRRLFVFIGALPALSLLLSRSYNFANFPYTQSDLCYNAPPCKVGFLFSNPNGFRFKPTSSYSPRSRPSLLLLPFNQPKYCWSTLSTQTKSRGKFPKRLPSCSNHDSI